LPVLRATLVTPLSGKLARFGRKSATALTLWAEQAAELPAPWTGVDLEVLDADPDPAAAMRAAAGTGPDVLFGPYGSSPALAAARATDRVVLILPEAKPRSVRRSEWRRRTYDPLPM
jgi:branched-chain amino acid transport system substrate-binding protein